MKKFIIAAVSAILAGAMAACSGGASAGGAEDTPSATDAPVVTNEPKETVYEELDDPLTLTDVKTVKINAESRHQTIESFGASGAWWCQFVYASKKARDEAATLLFDPVEGIGLNAFRYNIGGGSADNGSKSRDGITDPWRRAFSFETAPGVYDWDRDAGAVWFMRRAAELGADEIVMFVNSPLERLTINGKAYGDPGYKTNIAPENYEEFAKYVLDVAEHFKEEGLPIKYISPINEPAFEWAGGQEGCHYEPAEAVNVLKTFVNAIGERDGLDGVEISAPEGSSWRNSPSQWEDDTLGLCRRIMHDSVLGKYFTALDNHSYWSTRDVKKNFKAVFSKSYPDVKLRMSEWCEMVNGRDTTMDSAFVLAEQIYEDMTVLDTVSWHYWIAVSCYDYRDGLIYYDNGKLTTPKRLWSMGNYSRYIDRGYTRIDVSAGGMSDVLVSAYDGVNENGEPETVLVFINRGSEQNVTFTGLDTSVYNRISVNVTSNAYDLENTYYGRFADGTAVTIPRNSVTTVVISGK